MGCVGSAVQIRSSRPFFYFMRILLTNDDGYLSPGINILRRFLREQGHRVLVVAPDKERSAVSKALTLHRPLRMRQVGEDFYITDGTPNDCIYLALGVVEREYPDLVVSGINQGPNLGDDVIYSGTVGAAILATHFRIPSVAFSYTGKDIAGMEKAGEKAASMVEFLSAETFRDVTINVNFPPPPWKGIKVTRMGRKKYRPEIITRKDPRGENYYWIGIGSPVASADEETDIKAVKEGFISITPIHSDMTSYKHLNLLKEVLSGEIP